MVHILEILINDVIHLVYQELHRCNTLAINREFKKTFVPLWDDSLGFGISGYVVANYRDRNDYSFIYKRIQCIVQHPILIEDFDSSIVEKSKFFFHHSGRIPPNYQ